LELKEQRHDNVKRDPKRVFTMGNNVAAEIANDSDMTAANRLNDGGPDDRGRAVFGGGMVAEARSHGKKIASRHDGGDTSEENARCNRWSRLPIGKERCHVGLSNVRDA
jgi:hypothetical protein